MHGSMVKVPPEQCHSSAAAPLELGTPSKWPAHWVASRCYRHRLCPSRHGQFSYPTFYSVYLDDWRVKLNYFAPRPGCAAAVV